MKIVISLLMFLLIGCGKKERTEYIGHLESFSNESVMLRNPNNGHTKAFNITRETVIEVNGNRSTKMPNPVKGDANNCRITIKPGTVNIFKIEIKCP